MSVSYKANKTQQRKRIQSDSIHSLRTLFPGNSAAADDLKAVVAIARNRKSDFLIMLVVVYSYWIEGVS